MVTKQEDGTQRWLVSSLQKETESTLSTFKKTVRKVEEAYSFIREVAEEGGKVIFVGTKKQAQESIETEAKRAGMYYVNQKMVRWYAYKL